MSAKRQNNRIGTIRDAITGYAAVALGIVCFILALAVIMAIVRIIVGTGLAASTTATTVTGTGTVTPRATSNVPALIIEAV